MPIADIRASEDHAFDSERKAAATRQDYPDFGELAGQSIDLNRPAVLLDDDVVTDGQPKAGAFSGRLCREERIEHLLLHIRRDASAIVPDRYFNTVPEAPGPGGKRWLVITAICFRFALGRRVEAIQIS